jgi:hypothetical protein
MSYDYASLDMTPLLIAAVFNGAIAALVFFNIFRYGKALPGVYVDEEKERRLRLQSSRIQMDRIKYILGWSGGGVHKRIDENRELFDLLRSEAPEFLAKHNWVASWLRAHDEFFTDIENEVHLDDGRFVQRAKMYRAGEYQFPRPWNFNAPGSTALKDELRQNK